MKTMPPLPKLPFGNHTALDTAHSLCASLAANDRARRINLPDAPRDFCGHMASVPVGDLLLHAFAHTPITVEAGDAPGHAVMIPCFGSLSFTLRNTRFSTHAGHDFALLTGEANVVETPLDAHVLAAFDKMRLLATARHMLSPQVAEVFANPPGIRTPAPARREIEVVCDYVKAHLAGPIGLTELEHISGLSACCLQTAFQKQFQCSPMQWVRQERLSLARHRLLDPAPGENVTQIALDCGFTQLGAFASGYRALFGESPSETLRRSVRRQS